MPDDLDDLLAQSEPKNSLLGVDKVPGLAEWCREHMAALAKARGRPLREGEYRALALVASKKEWPTKPPHGLNAFRTWAQRNMGPEVTG